MDNIRDQLPEYFSLADDSLLAKGIAAAYQLEFYRLENFLLKTLNGLLGHMIAAIGGGSDSFARIRLLLQQSKRFGGLVKKIEDNDFSKLLSIVIKPFGDVSYCDEVHEALAVELAIENMAPESFFKKTGIPLASIDGGWASVRKLLLLFARQQEIDLACYAYSKLRSVNDDDSAKRLESMLEYYDGRLCSLHKPDASYQHWHELRKQICFSHALVKAALRYEEERVFMVKENYLQYVFEDFEAHFLANACWLVSEEGGETS